MRESDSCRVPAGTALTGFAEVSKFQVGTKILRSAVAAGGAVAAGWLLTYQFAQASFAPMVLKGLTFSGPSAELLMQVLASPQLKPGFDLGIIPGVLASFVAAALARELNLEGFSDGRGMRRLLAGGWAAGRDGTDTLTNVEVLQFSDQVDLLVSGTAASPVDVSNQGFPLDVPLIGTSADDYLMIGGSIFGLNVDLGGGRNRGQGGIGLGSPAGCTGSSAGSRHR